MNLPTIEELDRIGCDESGLICELPIPSEGKKYLTAIVKTVVAACRPQLRPIAEMPDEVSEGHERLYGFLYDGGGLAVTSFRGPSYTHFIDIALPSPSYPADFEAAFAESKLDAKDKDAAFKLWKGGVR